MAMDELEISKIVGAGCAALLAFVGFGQLGSALVGVKQLDEPAYVIEVADAGDVEVEEEEAMPIGQLMAMAVVDDGAKVFRKCSACHKMDDGANGVGPHLYGVVGRDIGAVDGYSYSGALMEKDGPWDFAALDGFLEAPKDWAPGTKMGFNGLSKPEDRASLIAWLNEQGPAPLPLPAAETAEAEPAEAVTAALEPEEEIAPGDVEPGEISEVDAGEAGGEVAVVNTEAPREAEVSEEQIADAAPAGEPAVVEAPVEDEEPARVETAEAEAEAEVEVVQPAEEDVAAAPAPAATEPEPATETESETGAEPATETAMVEQSGAEEAETPAAAEAEPDAAPAPEAESAETVDRADAVAAATFMIGADAAKGAKIFRKCKACHRIEADKGNGVGPNLHGVVGRVIASHDGFNYSDALKGKDGAWDFETLAAFLTKPKDWAPGTKMAFPGLRKEQDRADVIAYLNEQGDNPLPLPE